MSDSQSREYKKRISDKKGQGASEHKIGIKNKLDAWGQQHQLVAIETLVRMLSQPFGTLMTWLMIAIALTLPGTLWMAFDNLSELSGSLQKSGSISLYLQLGTGDSQASQLINNISGHSVVADVSYINADEALEEFRQTSGLGEALDLLPSNPLPGMIQVEPKLDATQHEVKQLIYQLETEALVDSLVVDDAWLDKLEVFIDLSQRVVWVIAFLLGLSIVLIVGNTIRLLIASRVDEILVMKLVGATNAWVRRPFIYTGLWFGMVGGLVSWVFLALVWLLVSGPVQHLAVLYGSEFRLQPLSASIALLLLFSAMALGWFGAWWSVVRHLDEIEP